MSVLLATLLAGTACSTFRDIKNTFVGGTTETDADAQRLDGFIGAVVADEPRAALAGRAVLAQGGTAADAMVATVFTLAVTLPSRAGVGAAGACLAYSPRTEGPGQGNPEAILFTPPTPAAAPTGADRPAEVPMLPRGMFALHARYGKRPFESLLAGPEQMARFGVPTSRTLARDLALVAGPLAADPNARAVFAPGGRPLAEGANLLQPDLGGVIAQMRVNGVGDLYQGALARRLEAASRLAGGPIDLATLRAAIPRAVPPLVVRAGRDSVAFLPPPADGGLGAAAAFQALQQRPGDTALAQSRALGAVQRWRAGGGDAQAVLASGAAGTPTAAVPAGTGVTTLDRDGNAVTCSLSMGNLFGTGRVAPGTGILLGAAPGPAGFPPYAAALAWNANLHAFRAEVAGSGQDGAMLATAIAIGNALRSPSALPVPPPEPGRANAVACARYLPGEEATCTWAADPRSTGLAASGS